MREYNNPAHHNQLGELTMAEKHSKSDGVISKAERRYQMGYISIRHENSKTGMTTYYSRHPSFHLKGNWLKDAGFDTDKAVTVRVEEGCLILTAGD